MPLSAPFKTFLTTLVGRSPHPFPPPFPSMHNPPRAREAFIIHHPNLRPAPRLLPSREHITSAVNRGVASTMHVTDLRTIFTVPRETRTLSLSLSLPLSLSRAHASFSDFLTTSLALCHSLSLSRAPVSERAHAQVYVCMYLIRVYAPSHVYRVCDRISPSQRVFSSSAVLPPCLLPCRRSSVSPLPSSSCSSCIHQLSQSTERDPNIAS